MRLLCVEYEDLYGFNVCCTLEAGRCGFYVRSTKIFALCKRIRPKRIKIWWSISVENFALKNAYAASRTWVGHEQRFLPQVYSLTCCSTIQRLGLRAKRLVCSLT